MKNERQNKPLQPKPFDYSTYKETTDAECEHYVWCYGETGRFDAFLEVQRRLSDATYWRMLAEVWQSGEVTLPERKKWLKLFRSERPGKHNIMTAYEHARYAALPEIVRVYRGILRKPHYKGLSWTLDLRVADWFAFHARSSRRQLLYGKMSGKPQVAGANIPKEKIFAVICGRGEEEVILDSDFLTDLVVQPADYGNAFDETGKRTFNHPTGDEEYDSDTGAIAA